MTDPKKPGDDDVEDIDWDQALSEWENTSFVPQVARDVSTDKPGTLAGAARPLYRPPSVSPAVRPKGPRPPARPRGTTTDDEVTEATRLARRPDALRETEPSVDRDALPLEASAEAFELRPRAAMLTLPAEYELDPGPTPAGAAAEGQRATADPGEPNTDGSPLLVPSVRQYDPNDETAVRTTADIASPPQGPADTASTMRPPTAAAPLPEALRWANERPASQWLTAETLGALRARAEWLEQEARAEADDLAKARGLLVCSEIHATIGDYVRAQPLAAEARDLAPSLALARTQARALMPPATSDGEDPAAALDAEAMGAEAGGRLHAMLLAAETLRATGREDAAGKWLAAAGQLAPSDVRAVISRVARALGNDETAAAALAVADSADTAVIAEALGTCLRMRGLDGGPAPNDHEPSTSELLLLARRALAAGDLAAAASLVAKLAAPLPELEAGAKWLAASLAAAVPARRADSARWLLELAKRGDEQARRAFIARAIELGDTQGLAQALAPPAILGSAERMTISILGGLEVSPTDPYLDATASTAGMEPLAAAIGAIAVPEGVDRDTQGLARAERCAGANRSRALVRLARLLTASAPATDIEGAIAAVDDGRGAETRAVALEMAAKMGRTADVSRALESWGAGWGSREEGAIGALAAALVAERSGDRERALEAFKAARTADPSNEAALRAIASLETVDLVSEMNELADYLGESLRGAVARLEAVARAEGNLPEPTRAHMLQRAHAAAPGLPIAAFLAERIARGSGDVDEVLRWIRERRAETTDTVERALDAVREALLIADREPQLAADRLQEAHRSRPHDIALRELYERMGGESPEGRAAWREQRAAEAVGDARTLLLLDAAREYDRAGEPESALRCAEAAGASDGSLGGIARERAELRTRRVSRLAEELLASAKGAADPRSRREAYERLAAMDAHARQDTASPLLWHQSILEETPHHEPSLRHVEHHLIGEGRDDELEPVASAIAYVLRGTGAGECTSHAELAARLRLRHADDKWDSTRDLVELAAGEADPSLWALRAQQAHASAREDDATFLAATLRLVGRASRPAESAALLVQAGEAAVRLGRLGEARPLLERAIADDPGSVVAWALLADICRHAGDGRGAAEAYEAIARSSLVREYQFRAWYDAGRTWLDEAHDEGRAMIALEAAVAIDVGHKDVFDRLSRLYALRKMHVQLAALLDQRIGTATDPDERMTLGVRRGQALIEAGDTEGARRAFEAALVERPDDVGALYALSDVCLSQGEWSSAEQALVQLARLLPTADEQRRVYARLGDLYARHLTNLPRAEVALKEVLKRAPDDLESTEKLVDIYTRENDAPHATELQQVLIAKARSPEEKRKRVIELAAIHEQVAHDNRRAEQALEAARREFPQDVGVLRALADFYTRHHQTPAAHILLDRAGGDARRALAAGRISPALFEVLAAVFELRDKKDAARVTRAMLAALAGQPAIIAAAGPRAFDPRLDDDLAPEVLTAPLRSLLHMTGDALDQVCPFDVRAMKAAPSPAGAPLASLAAGIAQAIGMASVQVLVSPRLGATCVPVGSSPPAIAVGEGLRGHDPLSAFLVLRALKLVQARASVLARAAPSDLTTLMAAWLKCFNPTWQPSGVNLALVNSLGGRLQAALPRDLQPDVRAIALEAAGTIGTQAGALGAHAIAWADRVALLALGDPNGAFDAIAAAAGSAAGAPRDAKERAVWVARSPEARDLIAFAVTDAFADVRTRLGIDR